MIPWVERVGPVSSQGPYKEAGGPESEKLMSQPQQRLDDVVPNLQRLEKPRNRFFARPCKRHTALLTLSPFIDEETEAESA